MTHLPRIFHLSPLSQEECELVRSCAPAGVEIDFVEEANDPNWEAMLRLADAVITGGHILTADELERAPRLKAVQMRGVGWQDRVPVDELRAREIRLATCGVGTGQAVAEHALMMILALQRRLLMADAKVRSGQYIHADPTLRRASHRLSGSTVGLIGMGSTASALARLLAPMGVRGLYYSRSAFGTKGGDDCQFQRVSLETLLAESDIVSLHLPGGRETHHFIGKEELSAMKPGAILVNTARGSIVDQGALAVALESGKLGGAGLDVFDPEPPDANDSLLALPNVLLTPHIASAQNDTFIEKIKFCLDNLACFLAGGQLESEVPLEVAAPMD